MIPGDSIITATPTVYSMYTHVCDNSVIIKSKLLLSKMQLVIVQWNFFEFNVLEGYSALYGAYSWHWLVRNIPHCEREGVHTHTHTCPRYFTEDVPVLLFTSLPFCLWGVWQCHTPWSRAPFWLALWELIVHSVLSHKEHRYVLPIVPIASLYAGECVRVSITDQ